MSASNSATSELRDEKIHLYDTTLRDGTQQRGISLSLEDKLRITSLLDAFGMDYIEGGWPGSNPKDSEYFERVADLDLSHSKTAAFGSTRRANSLVEDDRNLQALLHARTPVVTVVGKSSVLHVERILETTKDENLRMIQESVAWLKENKKEVIYDAEHFFDGFLLDPSYALETLLAAERGGADTLVLCDTNGGSLPNQVSEILLSIKGKISAQIGIHTHNDAELAVANALAAISAGARHVQGTVNGYGERCGNANLISLIPSLQLKLGADCVREEKLAELTKLSRTISECANLNQNLHAPYVGACAFSHKGGLHVAAVQKFAASYEHITPESVGNERNAVVSELSGRGNVRALASDHGLNVEGVEKEVLQEIKALEQEGYQFENAEASVELLIRRRDPNYKPPFLVQDLMIVSERREGAAMKVEAMVKVDIAQKRFHTAAEGDGPVHALDFALRKALEPEFPSLEQVQLADYKVRILDPQKASSAKTRVVIEARCGTKRWSTVGCSQNIIEASMEALTQSYELYLSRLSED